MKVLRRSRLKSIIGGTEKQMKRAVTLAAAEAEAVMNNLVPVDQGDLKSTISVLDEGSGHAEISAGGASKISDKFVDYELDVEFGTDRQSAQPFFRPGLDSGRRKLKAEMKITDR